MPAPHITASSTLKGWRSRVWAWVLFAALLKGLIPHAALASIAMPGDPALVWCAPGTAAEDKATAGAAAAAHDCVCAAAGDGSLDAGPAGLFALDAAHQQAERPSRLVIAALRLLPPPARGPPAI